MEDKIDQGGEGTAVPPGGTTTRAADFQLAPEFRQRIIKKIMDHMKGRVTVSGPEGVEELKKHATRFEGIIHNVARSQEDYLNRTYRLLMKLANSLNISTQSDASISGQNANGSGPNSMQSQVNTQAQNLLQPTQMHSSQQATKQPSAMPSTSVPDLQQNQQQQQQLIAQKTNVANLQQNQLMGPENTIPDVNRQLPQQRLAGQQNNLQQHQLGSRSNIAGIQQQQLTGNQPVKSGSPSYQHPIHLLQQRKVPVQKQMMSQSQSQSPLGFQQHMNQLQTEMQQRIQTSGPLLQQQKQLYQLQRATPEAPSTLDSTVQTGNATGADFQEEVYQKIKIMKELYLSELYDTYRKIASKMRQVDPQQPENEQIKKLKFLKVVVEKILLFLRLNKHDIQLSHKEKLLEVEKGIGFVLGSTRGKPSLSLMQGQYPQAPLQLQQPQSLDGPTHAPMRPRVQGSMEAMQQNNLTNLQHNSFSCVSITSTSQQHMINTVQPGSSADLGQVNSLNSLQQVATCSLRLNPVQSNLGSLRPNSNVLQHSLPKQHEQQMLQNRLLRQQHQQRHMEQQAKLLQTAQLPANQMSQLQQIHDANGLKIGQKMGIKTGVLQQQQSVGQHVGSHHPQIKLGNSSPQVHQALSPQVSQSSNSLFAVPSPSTSWAPSPMPGDSEQVSTGIASHTGAGNITHQQAIVACAPVQSLTVGTHANAEAVVSVKSSVEQPLERLLKVVKNISTKALNSSVSDINSVASMIDRIAGSAPESGSRAAVGEDLVAMTKRHLEAGSYSAQDGSTGTKKLKRCISSNVVSSSGSGNDSFWQLNGSEASESEGTTTPCVKRPRLEVNHALVEEIQNINRQLIDTVVEISDEGVDASALAATGGQGTAVKCSFTAAALSPDLKPHYASAEMLPIQPLKLLVPANYPDCSLILLDKFPGEVSKEHEDRSMEAISRFSRSLRSLSQPMSLKEIAKTWEVCARSVISEYAQASGGGTFSSKYGCWENCLSAA